MIKKILVSLVCIATCSSLAGAHFGAVIPSDDMVAKGEAMLLKLDLLFMHPMLDKYMPLDRPRKFAVKVRGQTVDLLPTLVAKQVSGQSAWSAEYQIKRPGDHTFYMEPAPYWEAAEDKFIIHYTKVVVNSLGMQKGWMEPVGLPIEILPLVRPYGLWAGNIFTGQVLLGGVPLKNATVEVEYFNQAGDVKIGAEPQVSQVVISDDQGIFSYAMPKSGWWAFAALHDADYKLPHAGQDKAVELGAVIWVKTHDM